jgi:hypothetical protein
MKTRYAILFSLFTLSCSVNFLFAQTIEEQMTKSHASCKSMFMNAMDVLPTLYKERSFDSLSEAVDIWERSCGDMPQVKITRILLNMEQSKFDFSRDIDVSAMNMLNDYATSFPSEHKMQDAAFYNETEVIFFRFSAAWSKLLLENKKLDKNEQLICRILNGEIKNPEKEIKQNAGTYPEFAALLEENFESKRRQTQADIAIGAGVWLPTNNLSTLGVHPSFTFQIGVKDMRNQLDLTIQLRYLYSQNPYAVKKDEQLDSTDYYLGYYVGLDYVYYLVAKKRFDFGVQAGMGYDAFDFAPEPYDYYYYDPYYTSHVTIGSFNANAGLRFNYYFSHSFYVGLLGRYNGINYSTHGGSNLSGDAVSIDLIFGFSGSKSKNF